MIYQRIRYFIQAVESGSFSAAAAEMYVTSQALTKQIGLLEEEVGGALFFRSSRGVTLTPLGEYAYSRFVRINGQLQDTMLELKRRSGEVNKQIRFGIFSSLPKDSLVTPMLTYLLGTQLDCQIQLSMSGLDEARQKMLNDQLDLLLTNTHQEDDWPNCRCLSFGGYPVQVVVSLLHPWTLKETITTEDMQKEIFLKMEMHNDNYTVPAEESFFENIPCRSVRLVDNFETLLALLQQGEGFAVIPKYYAYMEQMRMKFFDFPGRKFMFHTVLIYRPQGNNSYLENILKDIRLEFNLEELRL